MKLAAKLYIALLLALPVTVALVAPAIAATAALEVATPDTTTDPNTSGAFTPAVDDLLLVCASGSATNSTTSTLTSSVGGFTFTRLTQSGFWPGTPTNRVVWFVADQLVSSATSQTVTVEFVGDTTTGTNIAVVAVAGMTRVGTDAILQEGTPDDDNSGGATPTVVFGSNVLTGNLTLGCVANAANPATLTPPASWNELTDIGYATPDHGLQVVERASGFTGTTMTWGSTYGSAGAALAIELDTSAPASPAFDTGIACSAVDSNSLSCTYDANADAERIFLCAKPFGASAPADGAAVEAGTGCSGTATENTTGSSDSIQIDFAGDPLAKQHVWAYLEEGTANYSTVSEDSSTQFTAPTGYQFLDKSGSPGGGEVGLFDGASPAAADGDTMQVDSQADSFALGVNAHNVTINADTTFEIDAGGDLSRLLVYRRFSDYSVPAWSDGSPVPLAINDLAPIHLGVSGDYDFVVDEAVSQPLDAQWLDPENDDMTHAIASGPTGLSVGSGETLQGTPTVCGNDTNTQLTATDEFGESTIATVTMRIGALVPDFAGDTGAAYDTEVEGICSLVATQVLAYHPTVALGDVISVSPEVGEFLEFDDTVTYVESLGPSPGGARHKLNLGLGVDFSAVFDPIHAVNDDFWHQKIAA